MNYSSTVRIARFIEFRFAKATRSSAQPETMGNAAAANSRPIPQGSNSGCFDVFRVTIVLSSTWSDLENQRLYGKIGDFLLIDVTQFRTACLHNFNGYPHIFDHDRPEYDDGDVARRQ